MTPKIFQAVIVDVANDANKVNEGTLEAIVIKKGNAIEVAIKEVVTRGVEAMLDKANTKNLEFFII